MMLSLLFSLLLLLLLPTPLPSQMIQVHLDTESSPPLSLTCSLSHPPLSCAAQLCQEHGMRDSLDGLPCVELLADTFMRMRESDPSSTSSSLHSYSSSIFIDPPHNQPFYVRLSFPPSPSTSFSDHNDPSISNFCVTYNLLLSDCDILKGTVSQVFSSHSLSPARTFYFPVFIDDHLDLNFDEAASSSSSSSSSSASSASSSSSTTMSFRAHQNLEAVFTRFCPSENSSTAENSSISSCDKETILSVLQSSVNSFYADPSLRSSLLRLPTLLFSSPIKVNSWSPPDFPLLVFDEVPLATAVAQYCAVVRCPDRTNFIHTIVASISGQISPSSSSSSFAASTSPNLLVHERDPNFDPALHFRVVVSLTSLPSRLLHLPRILDLILNQTVLPDALYVNIPYFSSREQRPYVLPPSLLSYLSSLPEKFRSLVNINHCLPDYGPATKLIPTLQAEQPVDPSTLVVTVDDDLIYPPFYLASMISAARRYPNAALGLKGYTLGGRGGGGGGEGEAGGSHHDNYTYHGSHTSASDISVDALGGFVGAAYRVGFFDLARLTDYASHSAGAFFVDDDWIGSALAAAGVERIVLSNTSVSAVASFLFNGPVVVSVVAEINPLNGLHSFRNVQWQEDFVEAEKARGGFERPPATFDELFDRHYYDILDIRRDSMRAVFKALQASKRNEREEEDEEKKKTNNNDNNNKNKDGEKERPYFYVMAETGTTQGSTAWKESGNSALLFDRFLNFPGNDGILYTVDLDEHHCKVSRELCSSKVAVAHGDSVEFFGELNEFLEKENTLVDLIYLDSWDVSADNWKSGEGGDDDPANHALRELEALWSRLKRPGGIVLVDDNMLEHITDADDIRDMFSSREKLSQEGGGSVREYRKGVDRVRGKGRKVVEWMEKIEGCEIIFFGWQIAWVC